MACESTEQFHVLLPVFIPSYILQLPLLGCNVHLCILQFFQARAFLWMWLSCLHHCMMRCVFESFKCSACVWIYWLMKYSSCRAVYIYTSIMRMVATSNTTLGYMYYRRSTELCHFKTKLLGDHFMNIKEHFSLIIITSFAPISSKIELSDATKPRD